jgi:DNA-binding transcriptional LysR family regulator
MAWSAPRAAPPFDLDALMLFHQVVAAGSLTAAAARLRLAKSTVSRRLAQLERQAGAMLLKKTTRRLALTELGQVVHARCERIAVELEAARRETQRMRSDVQGALRVSMPLEFGNAWLGRHLAEFTRAHPAIALEIELTSRPADLIDEPIDIAIHVGRLRSSRLAHRRLATLERGVYASPAYLDRMGTPRSIDDFRRHECVVTGLQQREGVWSFRTQSGRRAIGVASRITVNSIRLARELVKSGAGLGLLPNLLCAEDARAGRLTRVLASWKFPPVPITALILAREAIPRKTRVFLDFLAERVARGEATG